MIAPGAILLAAGASTRLGSPKQLLPFRGKTLLRHALDEALAGVDGPLALVLGAHGSAVEASLEGLPARVHLVRHEAWAEGMGSSIRAGLQALLAAASDLPGVCLLVCDQPFVTAALLRELCTGALAAAAYAGTLGTPAYFGAAYFDDLLHLNGQQGAKGILQSHAAIVRAIAFPEGAFDVDTPGDAAKCDTFAP